MKQPALLIDTNVWLDIEYGDRGGWPTEFLVACRMAGARLGIASHSLKDVYYLIQRRIKLDDRRLGGVDPERSAAAARVAAWAVVEHILDNAEVVGSDYMDAHLATKHRRIHDDYEDDLIIAAAMRMKADLLVASDQTLLKHAPIAALSPQDATQWLANEYQDVPATHFQ
ncbi:MAG: hypothetical protein IJ111_12625 [Eggerthellaceae bacterium]|nr:hypothetical protein [Eggerthellaceae bacterium]